jgi:t-SNARE complex subunit (syntaxin)
LQLPTKATRNKNPMKAQQTPPKKTVPLVLASTIKKITTYEICLTLFKVIAMVFLYATFKVNISATITL